MMKKTWHKVAAVAALVAVLVAIDIGNSVGTDRPDVELRTATDRSDYNWGWVSGHDYASDGEQPDRGLCEEDFETYAGTTERLDGYFPNVDAYVAGCLDGLEDVEPVTGLEVSR